MESFLIFFPFLIMLGSVALPIIIVIFFYKIYKKSVTRAEERLKLDKQQTFQLQNQLNELNDRVIKIEKSLKEVD